MRIAIIVLAAGRSTRMNTSKQLLTAGDTTLLGTVLENALNADADSVYCVLGANAETIKKAIDSYDVDLIENPNFNDGLSSSIQAGIRHVSSQGFDASLVLLADQPKVSTKYINALIDAFKTHPESVWASVYEQRTGVPAIFPKALYPELLSISGDKGANDLLNSAEVSVRTISESVNLEDIDTPEDYNKLKNS